MKTALIVLFVLAGLAVLLFGICYVVMRVMFYSPPKLDRKNPKPDPLMGKDLSAFPLLDILCWQCRHIMKLDLKTNDSRKCLAQTKLPVLFAHGDADAFVPSFMAKECFNACAEKKGL